DGVLAMWLALVAPAVLRLAGAREEVAGDALPLTRKISSAVGLAQIVLVERAPGGWAPLATGDIALLHGVRAEGFLLIPASSEGLAAGDIVRPLPLPGIRRA
ncbi:MAG: molybdopterin binding domain, partial [Hyphomicrobiales bacterium]|nr:molybdopterin binding domain [Hyphomicrobiales bacterium]